MRNTSRCPPIFFLYFLTVITQISFSSFIYDVTVRNDVSLARIFFMLLLLLLLLLFFEWLIFLLETAAHLVFLFKPWGCYCHAMVLLTIQMMCLSDKKLERKQTKKMKNDQKEFERKDETYSFCVSLALFSNALSPGSCLLNTTRMIRECVRVCVSSCVFAIYAGWLILSLSLSFLCIHFFFSFFVLWSFECIRTRAYLYEIVHEIRNLGGENATVSSSTNTSRLMLACCLFIFLQKRYAHSIYEVHLSRLSWFSAAIAGEECFQLLPELTTKLCWSYTEEIKTDAKIDWTPHQQECPRQWIRGVVVGGPVPVVESVDIEWNLSENVGGDIS